MPEYSAGSASVRIRPNADDFIRDLNAKLRAAKDPGFRVRVEADVDPAQRETREWRVEEARRGVDVDVDADTAGASVKMDEWRGRQEARPVKVVVNVDTGRADRNLQQLDQRLQRLQRSDFVKLNIGAGLLAGIGPATAGLGELAAGLQQVAQAGLAVPGGIAAAAASIGTLVIGLSGVKTAYDAVTKASQSSATDQASQARAAMSASNQLRNSVVDEAQARKDVTQATKDSQQALRDLNTEMRGGLINESRAILEAQQARERLASGKFTDIRDALLDVQEADQRVIEVRTRNAKVSQDLADANVKGVEGSDKVVAANERLIRSTQQVGEAQAASAAASDKQSAAQKAAAQAMDQLSPNAQKFVQMLVDMNGEWKDLRAAASEPIFAGKTEEFKQFYTTIAPNMKKGLGDIGTAWNHNITALFTSLGSDTGKGLLDRIFGNTADAQEKLSASIDPLIRGMGTLSAAGTDALPRIADGLTDVSNRFSKFITDADSDGRLDKWINSGLDGMTHMGNAAVNLGKAFTAITRGTGGGESFLQWLESATDRFQKFLNSAQGQNDIKDFFADAQAQAREWKPLLEQLPGLFKVAMDGAHTYVGGVLPLLTSISELLTAFPGLTQGVLAAWVTWKTISPVIDVVQKSVGLLSTTTTNLGTNFYTTRDNAKKAMADVDDTFKKAGTAGSGLNKFAAATGGLTALGGPIGLLVTAASITLPLALDTLGKAHQEAAEKVDYLEQRERNLETTLDRVTGKITQQTRDAQISAAQNYNPAGPGSGVPGISKGDAVAAATSLGIPPDVYADALTHNPGAMEKVRDVLVKNNLIPEFTANEKLSALSKSLTTKTGGQLNQDDLIAALIGDPDAVKKYTDVIQQARNAAGSQGGQFDQFGLTNIAQQLSTKGQASVLAGGALNLLTQGLPAASTQTTQANQANYGRFRLTDAGRASGFFGPDAQINSSGSDFRVTMASNPGILAALAASQIPFNTNPDGTITATVPLTSPFIEKYAKGGPTKARGIPGPTGGYIAEVHPDEFMVSARGRATVPDSFLHALNQGVVDPRALPKFWSGGPGDGNVDQFGNPVQPGVAPGPAMPPTPIAPNPTSANGGVGAIFNKVISGIQGPIGTAIGIGQGLASMGQTASSGGPGVGSQIGARAAQVPGLIGLFGSMAIQDPAAQAAALTNWGGQTASWLTNFGLGTATKAAGILYQGGLGAFGLENSVLSPNNQYNQALSQSAQFALSGPVSTLLGGNGSPNGMAGYVDPASIAPGYGVDYSQLTANASDASLAQLYSSTGDSKVLQSMSPGAQRAIAYAQQHALGQKYVYGGVGTTGGYDCSGIASSIYAAAVGLPEGQRYFTTESDFAALGFLPGIEPGSLNIGVMRGGGGPNSHMVVTLPNGVNVESGGASSTTMYGGDAKSASSMPLQWHLPLPPGFRSGGPTPSRTGPGPTGGYIAEVHPDEFMISKRGRSTVPDAFLHKLNAGMVDPKDLPGFASGGPPPIPQGMVIPPAPPPPRPNFNPGPGAQKINPRPVQQAPSVAPVAPRTVAPAAPPPAPPTSTPAVAQQPAASGVPQQKTVAPAPSSLNHNLDAVNTGITSAASTIGTLASMAIAGGMGGAGIPGGGAAGQFAAGLIQQGGKIASKAANVVSSFLYGSVPGGFGEPGAPASGTTLRPDQNRPFTSPGYGGGNTTNYFQGYEAREVLRMQEDNESLKRQGILATHRG